LRGALKRRGFLTRDGRVVERKKFAPARRLPVGQAVAACDPETRPSSSLERKNAQSRAGSVNRDQCAINQFLTRLTHGPHHRAAD